MKVLLIILIAFLSSVVVITAVGPEQTIAKRGHTKQLQDDSIREPPVKQSRTTAPKQPSLITESRPVASQSNPGPNPQENPIQRIVDNESKNSGSVEIDLYGKKIKLSTILEHADPTLIYKVYRDKQILGVVDRDRSTGNLDVKCASIEYIDRVYNSLNDISLNTINYGSDTPSSIANKMIIKKQNNAIAIVGEPKSGRTVALTKILNNLRSSPEQSWPILIDAYQAVPKQPPADWVPQNMFSHVLEYTSNLLFNEVLNRNPTKVNILIDNLDRVPPNIQLKLTDYLQNLQKAGAGIVVTSNDISLVQSFVKPENTLLIPQLNPHETELFLTRQWDKILNPIDHRAHMEYAKATSLVLEKTPLFKNFGTMKQLSKTLARPTKVGYFGDNEGIEYFHQVLPKSSGKHFMTVGEYAELGISKPMKVMENLNEAMFNKIRLTERLLSPLIKSPHHTFDMEAEVVFRPTVPAGASTSGNPIRDLVRHTDIANYFAARHHIARLQEIVAQLLGRADNGYSLDHMDVCYRDFVETIKNPKNINLIEYIDSVLQIQTSPFIDPLCQYIIKFENEVTQHKIMDNLISNGFDELASALFEAMGTPSEIAKYFQNSETAPNRKMLVSTTEYKLGMLTEADRPIQADRQKMIFRKNMIKTIEKLAQFEKSDSNGRYEMWRPEEFTEYLNDFFLKQSHPNKKIYNILREYEISILGSPSLSEEVANSRLYNIIKYCDVGSGGQGSYNLMSKLVTDLTASGANPSNVGGAGSETLVHLAVSKLDKPLLKFVIETLGGRLSDPTYTLLPTALDANPLPFHSAPDFWETVNYLLLNVHLKVPSPVTKNRAVPTERVNPTLADLASPAYKLISGADPATLSEARDQLMVSKKPIEQLSLDVKSFRRRAVLTSLDRDLYPTRGFMHQQAIFEVLLKYRGLDGLLSPREQVFFEASIHQALRNTMTPKMKLQRETRVAKSLLNMVGTKTDYNFVKKTIDYILKTYVGSSKARRSRWQGHSNELERQWYQRPRPPTGSRIRSLENGVTIERATLFKELPFAQSLPDTESFFLPQTEPQAEPFEPVAGPSGCGRFRRRRRSASNCLVSKFEYDDFVKVTEENGKKIVTIDTEDFVKKASSWQIENEGKYQELIEIGKTLVDENNARLGGDYGSLFEENVKPRTLENFAHAEGGPTWKLGDNTVSNSEHLSHYELSTFTKPNEPVPSQTHFSEFGPQHSEFISMGTYHDNYKPEVLDHPTSLSEEVFAKPYEFKPAEAIVKPYEFEPIRVIEPKIFNVPEPIIKPVSTFIEKIYIPRIFRTPFLKFGSIFKGR